MLAPTITSFGKNLLDVLHDAQYEAPFAALYTCTATSRDDKGRSTPSGSESGSSSTSGERSSLNFRVNLMGSLGVPIQPEGSSHPMFPRAFLTQMFIASWTYANGSSSPTHSQMSDLRSEFNVSPGGTTPSIDSSATVAGDHAETRHFDWSPYIAQAMRVGYAVHVPQLPLDLMDDVARERGWKDRVRQAVVIPIVSEGDAAEAAVLILGCNPRRPYNEIYSNWVDVLRMTLGSTLNAVLGREAETRRADQLAQLDAAKTAFFSNASHELRTPLTLIDGPLSEALTLVADRAVKERLSLASRNTARLSRLVDSLMDFSQVSSIIYRVWIAN